MPKSGLNVSKRPLRRRHFAEWGRRNACRGIILENLVTETLTEASVRKKSALQRLRKHVFAHAAGSNGCNGVFFRTDGVGTAVAVEFCAGRVSQALRRSYFSKSRLGNGCIRDPEECFLSR